MFLISVLLSGCTAPGYTEASDDTEEPKTKTLSFEEQLAADSGEVDLVVWGAEEDQEMLQQIVAEFQEWKVWRRAPICLLLQTIS